MDEDPEYSSEGRVARLLIMNDKKDTFHFFSPEFFVIFKSLDISHKTI